MKNTAPAPTGARMGNLVANGRSPLLLKSRPVLSGEATTTSGPSMRTSLLVEGSDAKGRDRELDIEVALRERRAQLGMARIGQEPGGESEEGGGGGYGKRERPGHAAGRKEEEEMERRM